MIQKLLEDINQYIEYLKQTGLQITIHSNAHHNLAGLFQFNYHENAFCRLVKSEPEAWKKCICMQQKIFRRQDKTPFFGMCHAGVEEYIFYAGDKTFVSVSGYGINQKEATHRIKNLCEEFPLSQKELLAAYDSALCREPCEIQRLKAIIQPLCHMLTLLNLLRYQDNSEPTQNAMFDTMQNFVMRHFMENITVSDISKACACSVSTVCHLFKQFAGKGVHAYIIELRLAQACKLLEETDLSIGSIAQICGFSDANHFSTAFKKAYHLAPSYYRRRSNKNFVS